VRNIFVNTINADGKNSVVVAKEGETVIDPDGEKFVVMNKGRRYDGSPSLPDFQIVDFERYGLLIGNQSQAAAGERSARRCRWSNCWPRATAMRAANCCGASPCR
jgi:lipopolysaccharide export system permease protein